MIREKLHSLHLNMRFQWAATHKSQSEIIISKRNYNFDERSGNGKHIILSQTSLASEALE